MSELQPVQLTPQPPRNEHLLFDIEEMKEFLGEGWEHTPSDTEDYFKLRNLETGGYICLKFDQNSQSSESVFRAYAKRKNDLLYGNSGVVMKGPYSVSLLPQRLNPNNGGALQVNSEAAEFSFYPQLLQGFFQDDQGNSCYFDFGSELRRPTVG